jgi:hypothetical protein
MTIHRALARESGNALSTVLFCLPTIELPRRHRNNEFTALAVCGKASANPIAKD